MLVPCPFPANHGTPGAIRELCYALGERGHKVEIVTYPLSDDSIPVDGLVIHRVAALGAHRKIVVGPSWQRLGFDALLVPKVIETVRNLRADIIHAHNFEGALAGFPGRLITGRPLIYNAINTMVDELPTYDFIRPKIVAKWMGRLLDYWVPRLANHIIADTQQLFEFMLKLGIPKDRAEVVPSGVNVSMFAGKSGEKIRERYNLQGKPLVIYTGTFDRFQGLDELITGFPEVVSQCPEATLMLVGGTVNEAHSEHYRQRAAELGIERNVIIISAPIIAFYVLAGRTLESDTGRQLAWIAAATQAFAILLCVIALLIGSFALILAGLLAAVAVILLLGERDRPKRTADKT